MIHSVHVPHTAAARHPWPSCAFSFSTASLKSELHIDRCAHESNEHFCPFHQMCQPQWVRRYAPRQLKGRPEAKTVVVIAVAHSVRAGLRMVHLNRIGAGVRKSLPSTHSRGFLVEHCCGCTVSIHRSPPHGNPSDQSAPASIITGADTFVQQIGGSSLHRREAGIYKTMRRPPLSQQINS